MAIPIEMPKLSDTMTEGTLVKWLKQPGDSVEIGDVLAEVETDKATMEMEAFDDGVLLEIRIQEGSVDLERPHRVTGSVRLAMTDTRPLVEHFARGSRIVGLLRGLLEIEDVTGSAWMEVAPRVIRLEEARVTGEGLLLRAYLQLKEGDARGVLFARFKGLTFGIQREDDEINLRLRKPRRWFEQQASGWE